MWPAFEQSLTRHRELEALLADPAIIADRVRYTKFAKEHGSLQKVVKPYVDFLKVTHEIEQAQSMLDGAASDPDMKTMIDEELLSLRQREGALRNRLEDLLLMGDEDYG